MHFFISLDLLYFRSQSCNGFTPLCFFLLLFSRGRKTFDFVLRDSHSFNMIYICLRFNSSKYLIKLEKLPLATFSIMWAPIAAMATKISSLTFLWMRWLHHYVVAFSYFSFSVFESWPESLFNLFEHQVETLYFYVFD